MTNQVYRKKLALKQRLASPPTDIWQMSPYIVARFGGELTLVMLEAAQNYIAEKCLTEIRKGFNKELNADQS